MKVTDRRIYTDGEWLALHAWMPLAMSWHGWVSFCILQWFGIRLDKKVVVEVITVPTSNETQKEMPDFTLTMQAVARVRFDRLRFAWPLTGWYLSPRVEVIVPMLLSLPTLFAWGALVWWLL